MIPTLLSLLSLASPDAHALSCFYSDSTFVGNTPAHNAEEVVTDSVIRVMWTEGNHQDFAIEVRVDGEGWSGASELSQPEMGGFMTETWIPDAPFPAGALVEVDWVKGSETGGFDFAVGPEAAAPVVAPEIESGSYEEDQDSLRERIASRRGPFGYGCEGPGPDVYVHARIALASPAVDNEMLHLVRQDTDEIWISASLSDGMEEFTIYGEDRMHNVDEKDPVCFVAYTEGADGSWSEASAAQCFAESRGCSATGGVRGGALVMLLGLLPLMVRRR